MFTRIMVPVDGSPFSESALPLAFRIARLTGAELHFVQVHASRTELGYPGGIQAYFDPAWDESMRVHEVEQLHALADRAATEAGARTRTALLHGAIVDSLLEYAEEVGIDLIVATTHGRGGLARAALGSTAGTLVRESAVPVLVVRPDAMDKDADVSLRRILLPLDGTGTSAQAIEPAIELMLSAGAACTLLRIVSPLYMLRDHDEPALRVDVDGMEIEREAAKMYLEMVAARLRERGIVTDIEVVTHEAPAEAILATARRVKADLVAMATRGHSGWRRVVLGSVADIVMRTAKLPVLLVRGEPGSPPAGTRENHMETLPKSATAYPSLARHRVLSE